MPRRIFNTTSSSNKEEPLINLMPLIDVIFVVLVMYILIAPMFKSEQVTLTRGPETLSSAQVQSDQSVTIKSDDSFWFHNQQKTSHQLLKELKEMQARTQKNSFQVLCDEKMSFKSYQEIRDIGYKAGFKEVEVICLP